MMANFAQARDASKPFLATQPDAGRLESGPAHPERLDQVGCVLQSNPGGSIGLPGPLPLLPEELGRFASRYVSHCSYASLYSRITNLSLGQMWHASLVPHVQLSKTADILSLNPTPF